MSLIEQTKLPTTIPNLTGKYDSFKFATQFRAMDVQLPPNFLEIGTAEKGLRFDRAKWDKFQERIVASVKGLPEHLLVLGFFEGYVTIDKGAPAAPTGGTVYRLKANKPDLNSYTSSKGNITPALKKQYEDDMADWKKLPKPLSGAAATVVTKVLDIDSTDADQEVMAQYLRDIGQVVTAKVLPALGDQLKVHEKVRPLICSASKIATLEFPDLYAVLKKMVAGSDGQAVGDLATRWLNLKLVGGVEGLDDFLLHVKKMDMQFTEQGQKLTTLEIENKLKSELSAQNCKEAWDMRKQCIIQTTVQKLPPPEGLDLVDMMITIRTSLQNAEGKYTSGKARQPDRRDGLNAMAGKEKKKDPPPCIFFKKGGCNKGTACTFSHDSRPEGTESGKNGLEKGSSVSKRTAGKQTPKLPICYHCGETGHVKPECPRKEMGAAEASAAVLKKMEKATKQKRTAGASLQTLEEKQNQPAAPQQAATNANLNNVSFQHGVPVQDSLLSRDKVVQYLQSNEGRALLAAISYPEKLMTIRIKMPATTWEKMNACVRQETSNRMLADGACTTSITNSREGALEKKMQRTIFELPNGNTFDCNERLLKKVPRFVGDEHVGDQLLWFVLWESAPIDIISEGDLCRGGGEVDDIDNPTTVKNVVSKSSTFIWVEEVRPTNPSSATGKKLWMEGFFDPTKNLYYFAKDTKEHLAGMSVEEGAFARALVKAERGEKFKATGLHYTSDEEAKLKDAAFHINFDHYEEGTKFHLFDVYEKCLKKIKARIDRKMVANKPVGASILISIACNNKLVCGLTLLRNLGDTFKDYPGRCGESETHLLLRHAKTQVVRSLRAQVEPVSQNWLSSVGASGEQTENIFQLPQLETCSGTDYFEECSKKYPPVVYAVKGDPVPGTGVQSGLFMATQMAEAAQYSSKAKEILLLFTQEQGIDAKIYENTQGLAMLRSDSTVPGKIMMEHLKAHEPFEDCAKRLGAPFRSDYNLVCAGCLAGGATPQPKRQESRETTKRATRPGQMIHLDAAGKFRVATPNGKRYALQFLDDYTDFGFSHLTRKKSEFQTIIAKVCKSVEAYTRAPVEVVKSDGDGPMRALNLREFFEKEGITHTKSVPGASETNAKAERRIGKVKPLARKLMIVGNAPKALWGEAWINADLLENLKKSVSTPEGFNCPLSAWIGHNIQDRWKMVHPLFCGCWVFDAKANPKGMTRNLLEQQAVPGVYFGIDMSLSKYRIYVPLYQRVLITKDVVFIDTYFPFKNLEPHWYTELEPFLKKDPLFQTLRDLRLQLPSSGGLPGHEQAKLDFELGKKNIEEDKFLLGYEAIRDGHEARVELLEDNPDAAVQNERPHRSRTLTEKALQNEEQKFTREHKQDERLAMMEVCEQLCDTTKDLSYRAVFATIEGQISTNKNDEIFTMDSLFELSEAPRTRRKMLLHEQKEAFLKAEKEHMDYIIDELQALGPLEKPPAGRILIPLKWVYTYSFSDKPNATGVVSKVEVAKARLVLLGFMQRLGVDYDETFSPTPPWKLLRLLIALWTIFDWDIAQKRDEKQAYNCTPMDQENQKVEMWVSQPPGYEAKGKEGWGRKVLKSLPGAKQSGRNLHLAHRRIMIAEGWRPLLSDASTFHWFDELEPRVCLILTIFMDDQFYFGPSQKAMWKIDKTDDALRRFGYQLYNLGDITTSDMLHVKFERNRKLRETLFWIPGYWEKLLQDVKNDQNVSILESGVISRFPAKKSAKPLVSSQQQASPKEVHEFLSITMRVMYGSVVYRPEVSYEISNVARFAKNPDKTHKEYLFVILYFLNGTRDDKLLYRAGIFVASPDPNIWFSCDASWLDDLVARFTTMGRLTFFGFCLIDWRSCKIKAIMTSTNHAEFYSSNEATKDANYYRQLLHQLGLGHLVKSIRIQCDNEGAEALVRGTVSVTKCRHYDLLLFYQCEQLKLGYVHFTLDPSDEIVADIMTKSLYDPLFSKHRETLGLVSNASWQSRGRVD